MIVDALGIGELRAFDKPVIITCFGLGSCIGLFIKDRLTGVSAGAHIFLPNQDTIFAIDQMLSSMKMLGSDLVDLRAKIAGGGHLIPGLPNTGELITQSVLEQLNYNRIYLSAMNVGGRVSRTAIYHSETEIMTVKMHEARMIINI